MVWTTAWTTTSEEGRCFNRATCQEEGLWWRAWPGSTPPLSHSIVNFFFPVGIWWRFGGRYLGWDLCRNERRELDRKPEEETTKQLCIILQRSHVQVVLDISVIHWIVDNLKVSGSSGFWMEVEETVRIWMWNQPGREDTRVTYCTKKFGYWILTVLICRKRGGGIDPGRRYAKQLESNLCTFPAGIQHNHPDLAQNYDPFASTDINDSDQDPMPQVLRSSDKYKDIEEKMAFRTTGTTSTGHDVLERWRQSPTTECAGSGLPTMPA